MNCRIPRRRQAAPHASASVTTNSGVASRQATSSEAAAAIAAQLRAQIPCSTDPERLEQLACEAEGKSWPARPQTRKRRCFLFRSLRRFTARGRTRTSRERHLSRISAGL
jgi:hypothetical protein